MCTQTYVTTLCHRSLCDNLPKGALCVSEKLLTWTNVPLCSLDREKDLFCVQIWPPEYPFLLMSVTKQGQAGRFTPQWHPCYSVTLLPSVSPWLPQNISPANVTLSQKFLITEQPVLCFFFSFKAAPPASTVHQQGNALVPVKVCESDIWRDLKFGNEARLGSE